MKNKFKRKSGITLVSLVLTIIILLILAGITISSLTNTVIFRKAKEAKEKTQAAEINQAKTLNEYEDELNKYVLGKNPIQKLADKVKVGDYVTYTPDALDSNALETLKANLNTYSGKSDSTINAAIDRQDLKWRVLDVQNGQVRLISETPTTSKIELYGYNGYNNAVKLLDDACSTLYTNKKLASRVQNLKIEDIQDKMKEKDYSKFDDSNYGNTFTPENKYYPNILEKEKEQKVNEKEGTELGLSEQTEFISQTKKLQADSLKIKYTYWKKSMSIEDFKDKKYYELFINNGDYYPTYWMSSRCIIANSTDMALLVRLVYTNIITTNAIYYSHGNEYSSEYAFRPCVTLNFNVQVISGNGSSSSPYNIQ